MTNTRRENKTKPSANLLETYLVSYTCTNCGHQGRKELLKGHKIINGLTCEYCGCTTTNASKPVKEWDKIY